MNKNPFEIRLELLKMAQEMAEKDYAEQREAYWNIVYSMADKWNKDVNELIEQTQKHAPAMYTPKEIMEKAQELYSFVLSKGDK